MTRRGDTVDIVMWLALAGALFFIGVGTGLSLATGIEQQKAIDASVGHWSIDAESGEREFVYGETTDDSDSTN